MPDQPLTAQDAQILRYATETFAKIAVANAIWLTGEQLAQRDEKRADFFRMKNTFGRSVDLMKALPCSIVCLKRDGIAYFYALPDSGLTTEKAYLSSL